MTVRVEAGDCLEVMARLAAEGLAVDAVVTDPPYHLTTAGRFGAAGAKGPRDYGKSGAYKRAAAGFMGKAWDGGDVAFDPATWRLAFDLLKPGGHLLAFGGTRTVHRIASAVEDAGFEIRDQIMWLYGSGFPKSHDVSKAIDARRDWSLTEKLSAEIKRARGQARLSLKQCGQRMQRATEGQYGRWYHRGGHMFFETGRALPSRPEFEHLSKLLPIREEFLAVYEAAEREKVRHANPRNPKTTGGGKDGTKGATRPWIEQAMARGYHELDGPEPATPEAAAWRGWGTALKPACEPIVLARKPLEGSVAANVLKHGAGALNVDACKIGTDQTVTRRNGDSGGKTAFGRDERKFERLNTPGRWPANVAHDGSAEVEAAFAAFGEAPGAQRMAPAAQRSQKVVYGEYTGGTDHIPRGDSGTAARFFYTAKADAEDRWGSKHPTVKPVALMRWLARLVTPPGGTLLDPFAGSGTAGVAALAEGLDAVLIERDAEYLADIRERLAFYAGAGRHSLAGKNRKSETPGAEGLPLFGTGEDGR